MSSGGTEADTPLGAGCASGKNRSSALVAASLVRKRRIASAHPDRNLLDAIIATGRAIRSKLPDDVALEVLPKAWRTWVAARAPGMYPASDGLRSNGGELTRSAPTDYSA